jgi:hypothetical protein
MRLFVLALVVGAACGSADVLQAQGYHYVRGYTRRDGTYVTGHYRTNPDGIFWNNWSALGKVNPFTGQVGAREQPSHGSWRHALALPRVRQQRLRAYVEDRTRAKTSRERGPLASEVKQEARERTPLIRAPSPEEDEGVFHEIRPGEIPEDSYRLPEVEEPRTPLPDVGPVTYRLRQELRRPGPLDLRENIEGLAVPPPPLGEGGRFRREFEAATAGLSPTSPDFPAIAAPIASAIGAGIRGRETEAQGELRRAQAGLVGERTAELYETRQPRLEALAARSAILQARSANDARRVALEEGDLALQRWALENRLPLERVGLMLRQYKAELDAAPDLNATAGVWERWFGEGKLTPGAKAARRTAGEIGALEVPGITPPPAPPGAPSVPPPSVPARAGPLPGAEIGAPPVPPPPAEEQPEMTPEDEAELRRLNGVRQRERESPRPKDPGSLRESLMPSVLDKFAAIALPEAPEPSVRDKFEGTRSPRSSSPTK